MQEWLIDWVIEHVLKFAIEHVVPNVDLDHVIVSYMPLRRVGPEIFPIIPPERARLIVRRWMDYPDFYSGFAAKAFELLPNDNAVKSAVLSELELLLWKMALYPEIFSVVESSPLPVVTVLDGDLLAQVAENFSAALDSDYDFAPDYLGEAFLTLFWLFAFSLRTLFVAYEADQISRLLYRR